MATSARPAAADLVRLLRPKQWIKNVLVFAAPAAAGVLDEPHQFGWTLLAFVAFCLAASGTYCLNDAADVDGDRAHPTKRLRPVAGGQVPVATARRLGVGLVAAGVALPLVSARWPLAVAVAAYVAVTTAYTVWLKRIAVIDIAAVAAGFVIRAVAGAAATDVVVSKWFLIVASFGSLFMVTGKRSAELDGGGDAVAQRAVLADYPPQFLVQLRSVAASVTVIAYTLFAYDRASGLSWSVPWFELSIVPFVLAVFRYALRVEAGEGGAPEELVLADRPLQVLAVVWIVVFMIGVYAA